MEYLESILWFLTWPLVIYTSYRLVLRNIKIHDKEKE